MWTGNQTVVQLERVMNVLHWEDNQQDTCSRRFVQLISVLFGDVTSFKDCELSLDLHSIAAYSNELETS